MLTNSPPLCSKQVLVRAMDCPEFQDVLEHQDPMHSKLARELLNLYSELSTIIFLAAQRVCRARPPKHKALNVPSRKAMFPPSICSPPSSFRCPSPSGSLHVGSRLALVRRTYLSGCSAAVLTPQVPHRQVWAQLMAARASTIKMMHRVAIVLHAYASQPDILEKHQQDTECWGEVSRGSAVAAGYAQPNSFHLVHFLETSMVAGDWDFFVQVSRTRLGSK